MKSWALMGGLVLGIVSVGTAYAQTNDDAGKGPDNAAGSDKPSPAQVEIAGKNINQSGPTAQDGQLSPGNNGSTGAGVADSSKSAASAASLSHRKSTRTGTATASDEVPQSKSESKSRLIEEIIVTAQKRDENIRDVPISISAFNADYLSAKGVIGQQDLPKITPGLTFSDFLGFSTAYIRGIGSDAFILGDPLVVTYIDGVYFPASSAQFQDLGTVQKIEIDKGPQGTLFGRNALGGVISITTSDPSLESFKGIVNSTYTNFTGSNASRYSWNNSAYVSVPILSNLAISASGLIDRTNPYFDDRVGPSNNHKLIDSGHAYSYRVKLLWEPIDGAKVRLNVYNFRTVAPERSFAVNSNPGLLTAYSVAQNPFKGGDVNEIPVSTDTGKTYFGGIDLHTDWTNIQLLGSYQHISTIRALDFDGTPLPIAEFDALDDGAYNKPVFSTNRSAELRFVSNENAPDWITFVSGVYLFDQDSGFGGAKFVAGGSNLSQGTLAGITVLGLQSTYNNLLASTPGLSALLPARVASLGVRGVLNDKSIAGYAQVTLKPFEWGSITLGGRYTQDKKCIKYADQLLYVNSATQIPLFHYDACGQALSGAVVNDSDDSKYRTKTKNFDPKVSLNFRPGHGWLGTRPLLYVSYQTASIGDTYNIISLLNAPDRAVGSKLTAYEAGFKTTLFDGLMSLDGAAFFYKERNAQTQVTSLQSGGAVHFENVPGLRTIGGELGTTTQILPELTNDGLVLTASLSYLDSTYTDYPNASGFDSATGLYSTTNNYTGNQVVQSPRFTFSGGLNQTFEVPGGSFDVGVDYYFNSGFYYLAQNTPNTRQPVYNTLGFTTSYLYKPWNVRITVFGRNVLNEQYYVARFTNDFGTVDYPAQLATYGVTLHWTF